MPQTCLRCKAPLEPSFRACPHCGEPVTEFARRYTGELLDGKYQILERLGAGGMGEVYKATHTYLGSTRVIKVVHPHISGNQDAQDRFLREARAATKVQHPNVATLHDFSALPDGAHYMVWEYIDGENLAQRLRARGTLPPKQAVKLVLQALHGLEAIHRAGIVHRDISPENLMVTQDDTVKIIDLGVAKVEDPSAVSSTRTGIFVGKLRYASPEQLGFLPENEKIDARTDLYSIGMVLFELLTGRPPYEAKSPHEYFLLHANDAQTKTTIEMPADLPGGPALAAVIQKALARDRNDRYSTAREFATALEEVERTLPDPQSMPTMAVPLDGDATMKVKTVDTLHRETVRTNVPAEPTIRTPMPMAMPSTPAVIDMAAAPPARLEKGINPAWAVGFVAVFVALVGVAAVMLWPRTSNREPLVKLPPLTTTTHAASTTTTTATTTAPPATTTTAAPPQIAEASVTVTTEPETPIIVTQTTATVAPPPPAPVEKPKEKVIRPTPRPVPVKTEPEPEPERAPVYSGSVPTYVDGGDDSDANDRAIASLRNNLRGVNRVALRAGGMQVDLVRALREVFPDMEFDAYADVVIRFDGRFARLGRGRKSRGAQATIEKNGRVIFRYEMPDEVYRVGNTPAEAFARVLSDAVGE